MLRCIRVSALMLALVLAGPEVAQGLSTASQSAAAELPTFELMGFPIAPVEVQVMGPAHVQEKSPTPTLMLRGMPASPHQVAGFTPRPKKAEQATAVNPARNRSGAP